MISRRQLPRILMYTILTVATLSISYLALTVISMLVIRQTDSTSLTTTGPNRNRLSGHGADVLLTAAEKTQRRLVAGTEISMKNVIEWSYMNRRIYPGLVCYKDREKYW
jgi:hypothetical protein